eukprot:scaffold7583_cov118-Isochrysis_galbana.AAC.4
MRGVGVRAANLRSNRGKPLLGRWALYWEGVFGAAQNVGRFWCRYPARLLWPVGLRRASQGPVEG